MGAVSQIIDGVVQGILDKKAFKPSEKPNIQEFEEFDSEGLAEKIKQALGVEDRIAEEPKLEDVGQKEDDIYKAVTKKPGDRKLSNIKTTINELEVVSDNVTSIGNKVGAVLSSLKTAEDDREIAKSEADEELVLLKEAENVEVKRANARAESIKRTIRLNAPGSWFSKIKGKILPFLLTIGLFTIFKDKILEILAPVWERVKYWVKDNYPKFYSVLQSIVKVLNTLWNGIKWTWNNIITPLWKNILKPAIDFVVEGIKKIWKGVVNVFNSLKLDRIARKIRKDKYEPLSESNLQNISDSELKEMQAEYTERAQDETKAKRKEAWEKALERIEAEQKRRSELPEGTVQQGSVFSSGDGSDYLLEGSLVSAEPEDYVTPDKPDLGSSSSAQETVQQDADNEVVDRTMGVPASEEKNRPNLIEMNNISAQNSVAEFHFHIDVFNQQG